MNDHTIPDSQPKRSTTAEPAVFEYRGPMQMLPASCGVFLEDLDAPLDENALDEGEYFCEVRIWRGPLPPAPNMFDHMGFELGMRPRPAGKLTPRPPCT